MIGKNKGFKKLEDETKKTMHQAKLYHFGLIINIILIIAVIILCYMLIRKNNGNKDIDLKPNSTQNKIDYTDFKVVSDENGKCYVIGKKDDKWYEIADSDDSIYFLGTYKNNAYCYNSKGLCYIDFNKDNYEIEEWIKYREYKLSENDEVGSLFFQKAYLIDDTIYFKYKLDIAADTKASGILALNIDSNSFEDAKQIITRVKDGQWSLDEKDKCIYYLNDSNELKKYNIENKSEELIISNIRNFEVKNNIVLYLRVNNDYREAANSIVQAATYELRLYDITSKEDKLIFESSLYNVTTGNLNGFGQLYKDDIYYKSDNNIIKYNNGVNETVYTYEGGTLKAFKYRDDNVLKIVVDDNASKYIYDGKMTARVPVLYSVTMKDGSIKNL